MPRKTRWRSRGSTTGQRRRRRCDIAFRTRECEISGRGARGPVRPVRPKGPDEPEAESGRGSPSDVVTYDVAAAKKPQKRHYVRASDGRKASRKAARTRSRKNGDRPDTVCPLGHPHYPTGTGGWMVLWRPFLSIIGGPSRTMKETLHSPTRESGGVWRMDAAARRESEQTE